MQRWRSKRVERTFAHLCETGAASRIWLWGIGKLRKGYVIAAAHKLGLLVRKLFKMGTPRSLQAEDGFALFAYSAQLALRQIQAALLLSTLPNRHLATAVALNRFNPKHDKINGRLWG